MLQGMGINGSMAFSVVILNMGSHEVLRNDTRYSLHQYRYRL